MLRQIRWSFFVEQINGEGGPKTDLAKSMAEPIEPQRSNLWLMIILLLIVVGLGFVTRAH